ncbi:MAG: Asp-tRNA(Asn)/Glu-tRNA(Gln) amidotransferase subunit GatC [Dehalococcoidia bacterium]
MVKKKLGHDSVRNIGRLARIGLAEEEVEKLSVQMSRMLEYFEILEQLDTTGVPPAAHINPLQNVLRKDEVVEEYSQDDALSNAPRQAEKCFRVQAILE